MRTSLSLLLAGGLLAQTPEQPVRAVADPGIVTTRQAITPAGVTSIFQGRIHGLTWGRDPAELWVLNATHLYRLDWRTNQVRERVALGGGAGLQGIRWDAAAGAPLLTYTERAQPGRRTPAQVKLSRFANGQLQPLASGLGSYQTGGAAAALKPNAAGVRLAVVPLLYDNKLAVVNADTGAELRKLDTGIAPFGAVISQDGATAYVSNWAGRLPKPGELTGSPFGKPDEKIVVDQRGIAATGTITRVDLASGAVTHTIPAGLHPAALVWHEASKRLYAANANSESVTVIDTATQEVLKTITLQPFSERVRGIAPTALAVSPDGGTLYVACGGINAVAVVDARTGALRGTIPTGWYPSSLALTPDGQQLAVGTLLGPGSGWRESPGKRYVHAVRGSVAVLPIPEPAQLASYTTAVAENNRLRLAGAASTVRAVNTKAKPLAVPERSGEPSLIEHVVYIIKENRTYDQVLGDLPQGNGDPSLVLFGRQVTPNQHRLAEQFVLLDNFYATGGNSADGHQWLTQANEVDYCLWPGYQGRSYPYDGTDPMAYSSGGFLWDYALARGRTVRVYGEYAGHLQEPVTQRQDLLRRWKAGEDLTNGWQTKAPLAPLNKILAAQYPPYTNAIPDVVRAQIFLKDLARFNKEGRMPHLTILQLPSNHTYGTAPGASTPRAMVADNDLALGQIVEGLSKSRFWPKMAIFVVEDDAQNGVDHVDGHRTTAFVVSPYTRRGHVDSTFYSHQSMLKTIELILGLPTMSLFDLIANDMRLSFTDTPDLTPYTAVPVQEDLFAVNPPAAALRGRARAGALASARMRWDVPDAVPTERLNRIVWGSLKGWHVPYPQPRNAVFTPLAVEVEDEERDER